MIIAKIRRAHFGGKLERISDDQLALEELETTFAKAEAAPRKVKGYSGRAEKPELRTAACWRMQSLQVGEGRRSYSQS